MKNKNLIIAILLVLVAGGAGFLGGMKYQQSKIRTFTRNVPNRMGAGFRPVAGEIISADDKSVTIKLTDGSSKIVLFSDTTQINQAAAATKTDLKVGTTVAVFGQTNSDGSVTAQNIQINPLPR